MTASISSVVSAMFTNRRPSRPMVSRGTELLGPALTNSDVGAFAYAASTASPEVSALWKTVCIPLYPATPRSPSARACPTGRPMSSARGLAAVTSDPTPRANSRSPVAAVRRPSDTPDPIATDLPTATAGLSSRATPSASWVTPSSTIFVRRRWYCQAASPAPNGSASGTLRVHGRRSPPMASRIVSPVTTIAPARPPTAIRQLTERPQARAIRSSLRWASAR